MLKLEIRLNENKIRTEGKYTTECLNQTLISAFEEEQLDYRKESDGTLVFVEREGKRLRMFRDADYSPETGNVVHELCRKMDLV